MCAAKADVPALVKAAHVRWRPSIFALVIFT